MPRNAPATNEYGTLAEAQEAIERHAGRVLDFEHNIVNLDGETQAQVWTVEFEKER
ncbi:MAG: hypothetical protein ACRCZI_05880 [Cetobacterium sp.]